MAHHSESRRSEAARPSRSAEPDTPRPALEPAPPSAGAVALTPRAQAQPPAEHDDGPRHDPDAYDWYPVLRKPRADGWTVEAQREFIAVLADTGSVLEACRAVGKSKSSAYALRRAPGAEGFAGGWRIAMENASQRALDECYERALVGTDEPVFDRDGRRVGRRLRQSDRLLMFLLRAYMPERFRYAGREQRAPDEPPAPPIASMNAALALLAPPRPERPEATMDADELAHRLLCADIGDGAKPHWHKVRSAEELEREQEAALRFDEETERRLDDAKRAAAGLPPLSDEEDDDDQLID